MQMKNVLETLNKKIQHYDDLDINKMSIYIKNGHVICDVYLKVDPKIDKIKLTYNL